MDNKNNSGADPNAKPETPSFDDAVGKEQPVNAIPSGTPSGDQPDKKPDASKPEDQSGGTPNDKGGSPEGKQPEGDKSFWGKFKSEDDARRSYDEAQTKIIEQGKELNELKASNEKNDQFLSILDKALTKQPQLAEQLKAALAEAMKAGEGADPTKDEPDIEALLDKKLEERETKAKTKTEIDKWIADHEDFKDPEIGHKVLDVIEKEKLPFNARTLQLAYDSITKDSQAKKAADEALKKEEVKNLERENASGVGGGQPANKGDTPQDSPFDDLVGSSINPNKVR